MSISCWLDHSTKSLKKNYDFVIVGGGIAGLSTAYWLQKESPKYKIAILEKNRIGFGASGRNAGFVTCGSTAHFMKLYERFGISKAVEIWKFSEQNRKLLQEHIIEDQGSQIEYSQTGSCTIASTDEQWLQFKKIAEIMKVQQIDVQEIDSTLVTKDYGVSEVVGGIEYKGDGVIHPVKLLTLLKSKLSVDIYENTEVFAIEGQQRSLQEVKTD
ncbi:MAG TPA: FAD-dependent oxidoreductase, partial [Pseudobdellovibrionaceae bacterium]